ncbi:hypothetical protein [Gluconacetobacter diazotrophicus]|uniref:hypothetical protein n=1 Tax=Gluconacetobacter diazotrophicus TaxID=33996 RepID=UPI001604FF7B|nr:hypothetical protein [Gluconacetobacter diazotrophicus]
MTFKAVDEILQPDARFRDLWVTSGGALRKMTLEDHHSALASIPLAEHVDADVVTAFDRARNTMLYAFFDYDLFVVGELQLFGALELALKYRLNGRGDGSSGTLRNLVDRARKVGILPKPEATPTPLSDPIEALIEMRNALAHGTSEIHSPGMALELCSACAVWIDHIAHAGVATGAAEEAWGDDRQPGQDIVTGLMQRRQPSRAVSIDEVCSLVASRIGSVEDEVAKTIVARIKAAATPQGFVYLDTARSVIVEADPRRALMIPSLLKKAISGVLHQLAATASLVPAHRAGPSR